MKHNNLSYKSYSIGDIVAVPNPSYVFGTSATVFGKVLYRTENLRHVDSFLVELPDGTNKIYSSDWMELVT